ncbi:MAG: DUF2267 domain-containing protein [Marivirga sp.]|nr:DUF2267 domain-containing protein [Marivirga sp.]
MALDFEKYAIKGHEFLSLLKESLGTEDEGHATRILRSTFRVFRNHFTFEESLQLLAQLPMAIKSVYVDGWKKGEHKRLHNVDDFLLEVVQEDGNSAMRDFNDKEEILDSVRAVINTMRVYVSTQEMDQALATLPTQIRELFEPYGPPL